MFATRLLASALLTPCLFGCAAGVLQEPMVRIKNCHTAYFAWHARRDEYAPFITGPLAKDFERGWKRGYVHVASGGDGQRPIVPERRYWSVEYQSPAGKQRIATWFEGFEAGVQAAFEDQIGVLTLVPTSIPGTQGHLIKGGTIGPYVETEREFPYLPAAPRRDQWPKSEGIPAAGPDTRFDDLPPPPPVGERDDTGTKGTRTPSGVNEQLIAPQEQPSVAPGAPPTRRPDEPSDVASPSELQPDRDQEAAPQAPLRDGVPSRLPADEPATPAEDPLEDLFDLEAKGEKRARDTSRVRLARQEVSPSIQQKSPPSEQFVPSELTRGSGRIRLVNRQSPSEAGWADPQRRAEGDRAPAGRARLTLWTSDQNAAFDPPFAPPWDCSDPGAFVSEPGEASDRHSGPEFPDAANWQQELVGQFQTSGGNLSGQVDQPLGESAQWEGGAMRGRAPARAAAQWERQGRESGTEADTEELLRQLSATVEHGTSEGADAHGPSTGGARRAGPTFASDAPRRSLEVDVFERLTEALPRNKQ